MYALLHELALKVIHLRFLKALKTAAHFAGGKAKPTINTGFGRGLDVLLTQNFYKRNSSCAKSGGNRECVCVCAYVWVGELSETTSADSFQYAHCVILVISWYSWLFTLSDMSAVQVVTRVLPMLIKPTFSKRFDTSTVFYSGCDV